jgi:hypothetical protein
MKSPGEGLARVPVNFRIAGLPEYIYISVRKEKADGHGKASFAAVA